jgi:hypothetical protein
MAEHAAACAPGARHGSIRELIMAKMNYNRPSFVAWRVRNDQYQSPKTLSQADRSERRYAKLDPLLWTYDQMVTTLKADAFQRMLTILDQRIEGEELTNSDQVCAFRMLKNSERNHG